MKVGVWVIAIVLWGSSSLQASSFTPWQRGVALYQAYEFSQAAPWLRQAVNHPPPGWTHKQKAYALVLLSLCFYNMAETRQAMMLFQKALHLFRDVPLPVGVPENVKPRYESMREQWKKKHPVLSQREKNLEIPKKNIASPKMSPPRESNGLGRRSAVLGLSRTTPSRVHKNPSTRAFGHTGSVVVWGVALLVAGGAVALAAVSQGFGGAMEQVSRQEVDSIAKISTLYQNAYQTGVGAWIAGVTAGVLVGVGVGLFLYERQAAKKRLATALQQPRVTAGKGSFEPMTRTFSLMVTE